MRGTRLLVVFLMTLLALPIVVSSIPVTLASTGQPLLAAVNDMNNPTNITIADFSVSLRAGDYFVEKIDDGDPGFEPAYFAIVFAEYDPGLREWTWYVTFSGAQFYLYMSPDGFSYINTTTDIRYAGPFKVADLDKTDFTNITITNPYLKNGKANFTIGTFEDLTGRKYKVLIGPIPFDISADYKYIKIYDGITTAVAVSRQEVVVLPSIEITPPEGPAGTSVKISGTALKANELVNITYYQIWNDTTSPAGWQIVNKLITQVKTDEKGRFEYEWRIIDLMKEGYAADLVGEVEAPGPTNPIEIKVLYNATGEEVGTATFNQYKRAFLGVKAKKTGASYVASPDYVIGNYTIPTINVYVHDELTVAGIYFNPLSEVVLRVDGITMEVIGGKALPNATGYFNVTVRVPELFGGEHNVEVVNYGVRYLFKIYVLPTLELSPSKGPIGTEVTCAAYGFPESTEIYIFWYEKELDEGLYYNLVNGTTGPDGKFNVTVSFKVPHAYGGPHDVVATTGFERNVTSSLTGEITRTEFTITPALSVVPAEIENDGSIVKVIGTGFDPRVFYSVIIDYTSFMPSYASAWPGVVTANATGDLVVEFIAAGFRPGLHVIMLYNAPYDAGTYSPAANATFYVRVGSDPIVEAILSALSPISSDIADIKVTLGAVERSCKSIETLLTGLSDDLASAREAILSSIDSAKGDIIKAVQDVVPAVTEPILGSISSLESSLKGSIDSAVNAIQGSISSAHEDIVSAVSKLPGDISMYLTAIAILAALALLFSVISAVRVLRMK